MRNYLVFLVFLLLSEPSFVRAMQDEACNRREEILTPKQVLKEKNGKFTEERPKEARKKFKFFRIPPFTFRNSKSHTKNEDKDVNIPAQSQQTNRNFSSHPGITDTTTERGLEAWLLNLSINPSQIKNSGSANSEKEEGGSNEEEKSEPKPTLHNFPTMTRAQTSPFINTQPTAPKPRRWTTSYTCPTTVQEDREKYIDPELFHKKLKEKEEKIRKEKQEREEEEKNKLELENLSLQQLKQKQTDIEAQLGNTQPQLSEEVRASLFETWLGIDELIRSKQMPADSGRQSEQRLRREKSATGLYLDGKKKSSFLNTSLKENHSTSTN